MLSLVLSAVGQEHCLMNPWFVPTDLYPNDQGILEPNNHIHITVDTLMIDGLGYEILDREIFPFHTKDDLLRHIACIYDFSSQSENISGAITKWFLANNSTIGNEFWLIKFSDCGDLRYYAFTTQGLYRFSQSIFSIDKEYATISRSGGDAREYHYVQDVNENIEIEIITEPEYEDITELTLLKEAYDSLVVTPAAFVTDYQLLTQETSTCAEAEIDTFLLQYLKKDSYTSLEVQSAHFDFVTEAIYSHSGYTGGGFFEREYQDSILLTLQGSRSEIETVAIHEGCDGFYFYPCLDIEYTTSPAMDTVLYNVYEACPDGFDPAGIYCYTHAKDVPPVIETIVREKLIQPATTLETIVPAEYQTYSQTKVINASTLGSGCVQSYVDTIYYQKLQSPAQVAAIEIDAQYGEHIYRKYTSGGELSVEGDVLPEEELSISIIEPILFTQENSGYKTIINPNICHYKAIGLRLAELGYLNSLYTHLEFYTAVAAYQVEFDLPLGIIESEFIDHLEVQFGY